MIKRKRTILHLRDSGGIYGAERAIITVARHIDRERFNPLLVCMRRRDGRSDEFIHRGGLLGIDVIPVRVSGRFDLGALARIRNIIKEHRASIVHSHDFKSDFYALVASLSLPVKRVATAHGSTRDSLLKRAYLHFDERIVYPFFDAVVAVSNSLRTCLEPTLGAHKVTVIPNGIDMGLLDGPSKDCISKLPDVSGKKVFGVVGRLFPDKGHRFFLEAFSMIRRRYPSVVGLIAGNGPSRSNVEAQVSDLGLSDVVHICGTVSNMKCFYDSIDCLVIPSLTEGLPYVLLEAMASGVPVIATSVGDIPVIVSDGVTGYLVRPGDTCALAEKMIATLEDLERARYLAACGRKLIEDEYSAEAMVRKTEDLYARILKEWGSDVGLSPAGEPHRLSPIK